MLKDDGIQLFTHEHLDNNVLVLVLQHFYADLIGSLVILLRTCMLHHVRVIGLTFLAQVPLRVYLLSLFPLSIDQGNGKPRMASSLFLPKNPKPRLQSLHRFSFTLSGECSV